MDDPKIWLIAHMIVKEHGDAAVFFATQHADKQLANGDESGHAVWMRILRIIDALQLPKPAEGETVN